MSGGRYAMVLAAGKGRRLGAIGERTPKPLVRVAGKPLLDHVLDELDAGGVTDAVVNVHHLADQVRDHLAARAPGAKPRVTISDETAQLLETGGGVVKALPLLRGETFLLAASDVIRTGDGARALVASWDAARMDALMLLHPSETAVGFEGAGDFFLEDTGRLSRRGSAPAAPFVYTGLLICHVRLYAGAPAGPFSNNLVWDRAIAAGRLFGVVHARACYHVGTPAAIAAAQQALGD